MTGINEVWFVVPSASHAAVAEDMKRDESDPVLSAELTRLSRADAFAMQRFWEITTFRVRPGHEQQFAAAAAPYGASANRAAPESSYRVYEVIAGMPGPTYLIFSTVTGYAAFDAMLAQGMKTMQGRGPGHESQGPGLLGAQEIAGLLHLADPGRAPGVSEPR